MLKGKNILAGTALYLGAIWALYSQKKITFENKEELEKIVGTIGVRKGAKGNKTAIARIRGEEWDRFAKTKQFTDVKNPKDWDDAAKKFKEATWYR